MKKPPKGTKWCETCEGEGHVWIDTPRLNDWSERKVECEDCGGYGTLDLEDDEDG